MAYLSSRPCTTWIRHEMYLSYGRGTHHNCHQVPTKNIGPHIPGKENDEANALSRPIWDDKGVICSLVSVIKEWPALQRCTPYRVPSKLRSVIASVISCDLTAEKFVEVTPKFTTLEPTIVSIDCYTTDPPCKIYASGLMMCSHCFRDIS